MSGWIVCGWLCAFGGVGAAPGETQWSGVVEDFSGYRVGPVGRGHLDSWRWSDAERAQAATRSSVQCVADDAGGRRLHVRIDGALPAANSPLALLRLTPHFPPQADAVRLRGRIVSGAARLFIGGPTAYYADSDVYTKVQDVDAADGPRDFVVDLSLNHPLRRNFRRAGFSADARRIYYTRWAQEPLGLYIDPQSPCEFELERIEVVGRGEGRPFPEFAADEVRVVQTLADFEDGRLERAFNLYMADGETEWFEASWRRDRPLRFAPARLSIDADDERGRKSLVSVARYAEEVHGTGVRVDGCDAAANALRVTIIHDADGFRNTLVGVGRAEPIDFLIVTAPRERPFPWDSFGPDDALRQGPGPGFDYQWSYRAIRDRADVDFAMYQTRRLVSPGERTTLVLPLADFACIYGSGACRDALLTDGSPRSREIIAVVWLTPWQRAGSTGGEVTTRIDEITLVDVPGDAASHRSFWRVPGWDGVTWRESEESGRRFLEMFLPVDER